MPSVAAEIIVTAFRDTIFAEAAEDPSRRRSMSETGTAILTVGFEDGDRRIPGQAASRFDRNLNRRWHNSRRDPTAGRRCRPVIVCQRDLPDGNRQDLLNSRSRGNRFVVWRLADNRLWSEVLNLGGSDLLAAPLDEIEGLHVLRSALYRSGRRRIWISRDRGSDGLKLTAHEKSAGFDGIG